MRPFSAADPPRSALFIVFKGIGDVILTTPLLRALRKKWPGCEVHFFTRPASEKILRHNPNVTSVILRGKGALARVRACRPDITVDFMGSSVSAFYSLFSGARTRLAYRKPYGRIAYNRMVPRPDRGYTVNDRYAMLEPLGVEPDGIRPDLFFPPESESRALDFLSANGLAAAGFVTLDITSPRAHRQWPAAAFGRLADLIDERLGLRCVFLSGPGEEEYVKAAAGACSRRHVLCPGFDLLDLAALIRNARLHAGTTSSPMHIAVSQDTPTFTIYGPRNSPRSWGPPSPLHAWEQGELDTLPPETVFERLSAHAAGLPVRRER